MNKLLPLIDELKPIIKEHDAFFDCPLKKDFNELDIKDKLQIINDIVRQTMIYCDLPNPPKDVETLIGDAYTSCLVSIDYFKKLNLGVDAEIKFGYINLCESEQNAVPKPILLIKYNNEEYFYDATPKIDYKAGKVEKLSNQYQAYLNFSQTSKEIYEFLRKIKYEVFNNQYSKKEVDAIIKICNCYKKDPITYPIINEIESIIYNKPKPQNYIGFTYDKIIKLLNSWKEELIELQKKDFNYSRQIELAQLITLYLDMMDKKNNAMIWLKDGYYEINKLTPRLLYEKDLQFITIKPSGFFVNKDKYIEELFDATAYGVNYREFGRKTALGLEPMKLFHPDGHYYIREMTGPTKNFFVEKPSGEVLEIKRRLRKELKSEITSENMVWFDGMLIKWNPICLNFVHSSDNFVDACMGYTSTIPEYQIMTRFNYPNPVLMKEKKNERI